ncbi:hypothetical protein C6495_17125 [Candidatus Poribacteria bacterium]|nr:MAG: hypothetical protein C6495_17125 [Candidatus Poribacteria bacterium]
MPERNTLTANKIVGLCILGGGIIWTVGSGLWWSLLTWPHPHHYSFAYLLPLITVLGSALGALLLLVGLVYLNQVLDSAIVANTAACFGTVALVVGLIFAPLEQGLITLIAYIQWMDIPDENMDIVEAMLVVTVFVMSLGLAALAWGFSKFTDKRKWIFRTVAGVSLLPTVILVVALTAHSALLGDAFNLAIRIFLIPQGIGYLMIGVETYTKTSGV